MKAQKTPVIPVWINDDPAENEIMLNADGSVYIPIGIVEIKLTKLDSHWGTENYKFRLWHTPGGQSFAEGSIEVVVTYGGKTRKLVGAAMDVVPGDTDFNNPEVNRNFSATMKSESIKNAVKAIGKAFGSGLNDRDTIAAPQQNAQKNGKKKPDPVVMNPDAKMQESYNKAVETSNQNLMKSIRLVYPGIKYTGTQAVTEF